MNASGECSPTLDEDWVISDAQTCDGVHVTTGTGDINITSAGNLTLINHANVTTNQLRMESGADRLFINHGCEFIMMLILLFIKPKSKKQKEGGNLKLK